MNTPAISIVVPTYNGERYLSKTLDSVLSQGFEDWELVIIDDGSTDGSVAVSQTYLLRDDRIRLVQQSNGGVANARNRGLTATNPGSNYIIFLDQDDTWEPDALSELLTAIGTEPSAVGAYGIARFVDGEDHCIREGELEGALQDRLVIANGRIRKLRVNEPSTFASLCICNQMITPGLVLMKRSALTRAGNFDQCVAPADDYDLYARMSRYGSFAFHNKLVLNYRLHSSNASATSNIRLATQLVRQKLAQSSENTDEQAHLSKIAYRSWQKHQI